MKVRETLSHIYVKSEKVIGARPDDVYQVLADYKGKHPNILTPNYQDYTVEKGGQGSGTVVSYRLQAAGRERPYRMRVDEPLRGKVLVERDTNSSLVTIWTLTPVADGQRTRVRLASEWEGSGGVGGFFERTFAPLGLSRVYSNVLATLASSLQSSDTSQDEVRPGVPPGLVALLGIFGAVVGFAFLMRYLRRRGE